MPDRCTNGACDSTDAPQPIGNGKVKCFTCLQVTVEPHETKHWDGDGFAADEWAWS